ncbi:MAG TPA: sugar transferase [Sulfuricurvum sp.]|nr:sugar transferase [Sulfuricurvum sp.]HQT36677.1 sugar transferase [Sulfuricurvum sp.]
MYKSILKPLIDFTGALILLILFFPIILLTALLIRIKLGRQILFTQSRPGYKGKVFTIYKFRTMSNVKDLNGELLSDEQRLGKFGQFIRSTSLDELPQLWNVLKGDMSFIGPRPLLSEYLPLYTPTQAKRHDVKPGITGWAQVNGRNAISWEEKFRYDVDYVNTLSFRVDFKIFCLTLKKVSARENINKENMLTTTVFKGNMDDK